MLLRKQDLPPFSDHCGGRLTVPAAIHNARHVARHVSGLRWAAIVAFVLALAVLTIGVARAFRALQSQVLRTEGGDSPASALPILGAYLPPLLVGADPENRPVCWRFADHRLTLLIAVSPECGECERSWPFWQHVVTALGASRNADVLVAGVGLPLPKDFVASHAVREVHAMALLPHETVKISSVPLALAVGSDRRIIGVWSGPTTSERATEIIDFVTKHAEKRHEVGAPSPRMPRIE